MMIDAAMIDAAMPDAPPPDAPIIDAPACSPAMRVCATPMQSGHCDAQGQTVVDRNCPPGSQCANGYCQPPAGAQQCVNRVNCTGGKACDLYVTSNGIRGFCTDPAGTGGPLASCSTGSDCRTGVCATDGQGNQNCLELCGMNCPPGVCADVTSTLEGADLAGVKSCFQ
jgi:hypothetical protein